MGFEFSVVYFVHYIEDLKYPRFECICECNLFPTCNPPYTTMQCGRFFPEDKKKLCNRKSPAFVLEMSTVYLGLNIENVTFKINLKKK